MGSAREEVFQQPVAGVLPRQGVRQGRETGGGTVPSQAFGLPHCLVVSSSQETFPVEVFGAVYRAEVRRFGGPRLTCSPRRPAFPMGPSLGVEQLPQVG